VSAQLRGVQDTNYNQRFVKKLSQVTVKDVQAAAKKYLPLFQDPKLTHTAIVCSPKQLDGVEKLMRVEYGLKDLLNIEDLDNSVLTEK